MHQVDTHPVIPQRSGALHVVSLLAWHMYGLPFGVPRANIAAASSSNAYHAYTPNKLNVVCNGMYIRNT